MRRARGTRTEESWCRALFMFASATENGSRVSSSGALCAKRRAVSCRAPSRSLGCACEPCMSERRRRLAAACAPDLVVHTASRARKAGPYSRPASTRASTGWGHAATVARVSKALLVASTASASPAQCTVCPPCPSTSELEISNRRALVRENNARRAAGLAPVDNLLADKAPTVEAPTDKIDPTLLDLGHDAAKEHTYATYDEDALARADGRAQVERLRHVKAVAQLQHTVRHPASAHALCEREWHMFASGGRNDS